jgi:hypothetical protein
VDVQLVAAAGLDAVQHLRAHTQQRQVSMPAASAPTRHTGSRRAAGASPTMDSWLAATRSRPWA